MSYKNVTWRVAKITGFDGLKLDQDAPIPDIGEYDCLVKIEASSLNYRDLMIPKVD